MLTYLLVWIVALGSLGIYLTAFFFPELHRKNDLIWSGVGLFYALVLWVYSDRIRGGFLLGQTAGVALLVWLGWQTWQLRRELTPADLKTPIPADLKDKLSGLVATVQSKLGSTASQPAVPSSTAAPSSTEVASAIENAAQDAWDDASPSAPVQAGGKPSASAKLPQQAKEAISKVDVAKLKTQATGLLDQLKAKLQDLGILSKPSAAPKGSTSTAVAETVETVETIVAEVGESAAVVEAIEIIETVVEEAVAEAPDPEAVATVEPPAVVEEMPEAPEAISPPEIVESVPVETDSADSPEPPAPDLSVAEAAIADNSLIEPSEPQPLDSPAQTEPEPVESSLEPEAAPETLTTNESTPPDSEQIASVAHELMESVAEEAETTETPAEPKPEDQAWPPPEPMA